MKKALFFVLLCWFFHLDAQHTFYNQDFENPTISCPENWNYTGGVRTTDAAFNGSYSLRVGRLGESHTVTFDAIDVSELINGQLTLRHRVLTGMGPGIDTREGVAFLISLNGGPYDFISGITGYGDISHNWNQTAGSTTTSSGCNSYQTPNPFSYSIPAGTNSISLKVISVREGNCTSFNNSMENGIGKEFNRSDEGIYLDGITITGDAPILNIPTNYCGGGSNSLPMVSENAITGTWSPSNITSSGTYTFSPNMGGCVSNSFQINVTPQPPEPASSCYETTTWNETTCAWEISGSQPTEPATACYETATWNETSCSWEISGSQTPAPVVDCHESATFDETLCEWVVSGEPNTTIIEEEICPNELPYTWNGIVFNQAGSQSLVEQAANGCDSTITLMLTVIEMPDFSVSYQESTDCQNTGSLVFSDLFANTQYELSTNLSGVSTFTSNASGEITITDITEGTYTDFTISNGTCSATIEEEIIILLPSPPIIFAGDDLSICEGESITLEAINPDNALISWSNGVEEGSPFNPPLGTTVYTVTAEKEGCISTDDVVVQAFITPTVDAGNDMSICEGESITLSALNPDNADLLWSNDVFDGTTIQPSLGETTYTVTATIGNCVSADSFIVTTSASIEAALLPYDTLLCKGENILFSYEISNGTPVSCLWEFGDGTSSTDFNFTNHTYTSEGCYDLTLTLTNAGGCESSFTTSDAVCALEGPSAAFDMSQTEVTSTNNLVQFTNLSQDASEYSWDFGDNSYSSDENPTHYYSDLNQETFVVTLIAEDESECSDSISRIITYRKELQYYIPNAFTPDGLNENNFFQPIFESTSELEDYSFTIYNRWGNRVFESSDPSTYWDGTYRGQLAPEGVYVWKLTYRLIDTVTNEKNAGHVTLLR